MDHKNTDIDNPFFTRGCRTTPNLISSNEDIYKSSCCKLDSYNWLTDINVPESQENKTFVEVRFKNNRKDIFVKKEDFNITIGDIVAVEASPGHDIGIVSQTGTYVYHIMQKQGISPKNHSLLKVYRKARMSDIEKWIAAVENEHITMIKSRQIAASLDLNMKINDIEYQGDNTKAIFYYTADERVDFRQLIKMLAERFKIRIEMKQIGVRQEASKVGGIGSCGREMCCAAWHTNFQSVSTNSARTQQLSLNPQKLAGQCGKLKCCLNFEQSQYEDALKRFPDTSIPLKTKKGQANHQKTDIYKELMWYHYNEEGTSTLIPLTLKDVKEIIGLNEKNKFPESLNDFVKKREEEHQFEKVVGQDDLHRFDKK
ncbi:MAG: regulatory iron-sulfur-containing complex subunit RicT [Bacteroidota bacterium]|nr:regulatory iron-sulfur-containing complex subunit RicT [Bacteroidota bacterium]